MEKISPLTLVVTRVDLDFTRAGIATERVLQNDTQVMRAPKMLPDIIVYLQKETELTRHTLVAILRGSNRMGDFRVNPQQFMALAAREIGYAVHGPMLEGIKYEKIANPSWEMQRIEADAG